MRSIMFIYEFYKLQSVNSTLLRDLSFGKSLWTSTTLLCDLQLHRPIFIFQVTDFFGQPKLIRDL